MTNPVKITKPAAKQPAKAVKAAAPAPTAAPVAPVAVTTSIVVPAPATPAPETHVNIELVEGLTYVTLHKTYTKGTVYRVPMSVWAWLRRERESMKNLPYFAISKRKPSDFTESDPAKAGVRSEAKGTGITITHQTPEAMTDSELRKAGLDSWAGNVNNRRASPAAEVDTGADMVGTAGETEDIEGEGEGYDGLDVEGADDDLAAAGLAPSKVLKTTHGPRNAAAKAALGLPAQVVPRPTAVSADDEVQV